MSRDLTLENVFFESVLTEKSSATPLFLVSKIALEFHNPSAPTSTFLFCGTHVLSSIASASIPETSVLTMVPVERTSTSFYAPNLLNIPDLTFIPSISSILLQSSSSLCATGVFSMNIWIFLGTIPVKKMTKSSEESYFCELEGVQIVAEGTGTKVPVLMVAIGLVIRTPFSISVCVD